MATGIVGWRTFFAALPQAVIQDVSNTSQATDRDADTEPQEAAPTDVEPRKRYDALLWPGGQSPDVALDLTKFFVKRDVGEHFDTVIDPQFPAQTGLPMTVYISQKQDHRPASIEVSQFYGNHHNLSDIFTITVPSSSDDPPRMIGDTGRIRLEDLAKAYKFIEMNRNLLLDVWENGEDESNDMAWKYYKYIVRIV